MPDPEYPLDPDETLPKAEPAAVVAALNVATGSTVVVLALLFDWSGDVTAALTAAFTAWVGVGGLILRSKVTPNGRVIVRRGDT